MKEKMNLNLRDSVKEGAVAYCKAEGVSLSSLVEQLLRNYLLEKGVIDGGLVPRVTERFSKEQESPPASLARREQSKKKKSSPVPNAKFIRLLKSVGMEKEAEMLASLKHKI